MGKNENGAGTDLYSAGDGTEEGARSIVTKSLRPMDFIYCVPTSMMSLGIELSRRWLGCVWTIWIFL
ncbi:hypothetical protein BT69DRAFT_1275383 [Atractiella rhizophila]|nr:hypothetical protein BT69DRAFT_1275383 [Atractiella rhizophila]